jgi:hypothetical protein
MYLSEKKKKAQVSGSIARLTQVQRLIRMVPASLLHVSQRPCIKLMSHKYNLRVIRFRLASGRPVTLLTGPAPSDTRIDIWPQESGCIEHFATDTFAFAFYHGIRNSVWKMADLTRPLATNHNDIDLTVGGTDCPVFPIH